MKHLLFLIASNTFLLTPEHHLFAFQNESRPQTSPIESSKVSYSESPNRKLPFRIQSDWIASNEAGLLTTQVGTSVPVLLGGGPPPIVNIRFGLTQVFDNPSLEIPNQLFDYSVGLSWVKKLNDRWTGRAVAGVGFATDHQNQSSDAWQFRGGVFGVYEQSEKLSWTLGALATGRDDLPVIPAIGAVWKPGPSTRLDLLFPKPKLNILAFDDGRRQHWIYVGAAINGTTWAIQGDPIQMDRVTYNDFRLIGGLELFPSNETASPYPRGSFTQLEIGFAFGRQFEFESQNQVRKLSNGFTIGFTRKF